MADKTYTQDEHDAVLAQVEDLKAKLEELSHAAEASQVDAKVAAATAELDSKVADLQAQLDTAVLEAETAKEARDSVVAWLEGEKVAAEEAASLEARKADRIAQVKEVASFPEEYLTANADRFAAMSDETFSAAIEDWKTISVKKSEKAADLPSKTALTASRDKETSQSVLSEVLNLRFQGVDVRTVR